jgi:hypothetical protein
VLCGLSGVMGGAAQVLYAYDDDASVLSGFPITQVDGDAAEGNITVADIDGDADMEVLFTSNLMRETLGYVYAVHHDGSPVSGWPMRIFGFSYLNGMTVADVDGDDSLDIIAVAANGASGMEVRIWEAGVPFNRLSWEWPTYHFDMARTGRYVAPDVGVEQPKALDAPRIRLEARPNPCRGQTAISLQLAASSPKRLDVFDATGRLVLARSVRTSPFPLSTSGLAAGAYFLRVSSGGRAASTRLVVTR